MPGGSLLALKIRAASSSPASRRSSTCSRYAVAAPAGGTSTSVISVRPSSSRRSSRPWCSAGRPAISTRESKLSKRAVTNRTPENMTHIISGYINSGIRIPLIRTDRSRRADLSSLRYNRRMAVQSIQMGAGGGREYRGWGRPRVQARCATSQARPAVRGTDSPTSLAWELAAVPSRTRPAMPWAIPALRNRL